MPPSDEDDVAKLRRMRGGLLRALPGVYAVVLRQALQGVPWAARLLLEHVEKFEEQVARERENVITFTWSPPKEPAPEGAPPADEGDGC